jgi:hypothetical protein
MSPTPRGSADGNRCESPRRPLHDSQPRSGYDQLLLRHGCSAHGVNERESSDATFDGRRLDCARETFHRRLLIRKQRGASKPELTLGARPNGNE